MPPKFRVDLPLLDLPPDEEGQGWVRPPVWEHHPDAHDDFIELPNGRPIYALIVAGFANNASLDELLVYDFARYLMAQGAYVHWAWWNNLLAEYMERPLHHPQSHPGSIDPGSFLDAAGASEKAVPGEDYQFVADAERMLAAIRENNPSAMIVVVGHSMGGASVVHLGTRTNVVIDVLAPIDPVGNRNYPWAGPVDLHGGGFVSRDYNWTRWRVTRANFLGYRSLAWNGDEGRCEPVGPWLKDVEEADNDFLCSLLYTFHDAPPVRFGGNIVNLFHRYQKESLFPFDFTEDYLFVHTPPPGRTAQQEQAVLPTDSIGWDPGGWPLINPVLFPCCPSGNGVAWPADGHGEVVGYRGPVDPINKPIPMGVRVRTSPNCGRCVGMTWPSREIDPEGVDRRPLLEALEDLPLAVEWPHRPTNPDLCLVSDDLIALFAGANRPPEAHAGEDQVLECTGQSGTPVILDGLASSDPEGDPLDYMWTWPGGDATGPMPTIFLPVGQHCITLTVRDPSGHVDTDIVAVTIADTTPPELTVILTPSNLWPPNHEMVTIRATVEAHDLCGPVTDLALVSITSSDDDDGHGDGHTTEDIAEAEPGTLDLSFQLRAERAGGTVRTYTITYQATDPSSNRRETSAKVTVKSPNE